MFGANYRKTCYCLNWLNHVSFLLHVPLLNRRYESFWYVNHLNLVSQLGGFVAIRLHNLAVLDVCEDLFVGRGIFSS